MALRDWEDPEAERQAIERERARRQRIEAYQKTASPQVAQRVSGIAANYPHMSPGTAVPLAQAGHGANSPLTQQVAVKEAKRNKKKRDWWGALGDIVTTPVRAGAWAASEAGELGGDVLKPVVRGGIAAFSALAEEPVGLLGNVAAEAGEFVAGAAAGAITGAGLGLAAGPFAGITVPAGAIGGALAGGTLGAIGQAKNVVKGEADWRPQSTLGVALTGGGSMGQGYLPAGRAGEEAIRRRQASANIGGHAFTPGRLLASAVFAPDTAAFNVMSGAVDFSNAWKMDPAEHGLRAVGVARAARARFVPKVTEKADDATRAAAGIIEGGTRPSLAWENVSRWLTADRRGQRFTQWVTETDNFEDIRRALPGVSPETALDLKNATTREAALEILLPHVDDAGVARGLHYERGLQTKNLRPATLLGANGMTVRRQFAGSRFWATVPGDEVQFLDTTESVEWFSNMQRNMRLPYETVSQNNEALAVALRDQDYRQARAVIARTFVAPGARVANVAPDVATAFLHSATDTYLRSIDEVERAAFFETGLGTRVSRADIDNESFELVRPEILSADLGVAFKVNRAEIREIRRATSRFAPLYDVKYAGSLVETGTAIGDFLTAQVWKPFALLRGAYTVRVIAEEQIRIANSGMVSMFAHPLSYIAWAASDQSRLGKFLEARGVTVTRGDIDILGQAFTEAPAELERAIRGHANEFQAAMGRKMMQEHWGIGTKAKGHKTTYLRGQKHYGAALHDRIARMHLDPVLRRVANGDLLADDAATFRRGPTAVHHYFSEGDGREVLRSVGRLTDTGGVADVDEILAQGQRLVDDVVGAERVSGPAYGTLAPPVSVPAGPGVPPGRATYGQPPTPARQLPPRPTPPEPLPAPAGGGARYARSQEAARQQETYRKELAAWEAEVARIRGAEEAAGASRAQMARTAGVAPPGPPKAAGISPTPPANVTTTSGDLRIRQAIATGELDGVSLFNPNGSLNPEFTRKLDEIALEGHAPMKIEGDARAGRSLTDKWNKGVESWFNALMGNRTANLSRSPYFRQFYWREAADFAAELDAASQAKLLAMLDEVELPPAMADAVRTAAKRGTGPLNLEQADTLLKGRALDSTRNLLYDVAKRGQSSDILRIIFPFLEAQKEVLKTWAKIGTENPTVLRRLPQIISGARGTGTFYKDPQTGEEMFMYPGSQILTEKIFGIPIPLGGRVEGLSMFGSGLMPGAGPVVQLTARSFLPDKPRYDQLRDMIDPFGETAQGGILEQFAPGWMKSFMTGKAGDDSDQRFGDTVFDVYTAGLSSGKYRNDTPEHVAEDMEKATQSARWIYMLQGAASFAGAPTKVDPKFRAMDKDGRWELFGYFKEELRAFQEEDWRSANEKFLTKFGPGVAALMQPSTYAPGKVLAEATADAGRWVRTHTALVERYPNTYGVFAPISSTDDFDFQTWARQVRTGERIPLDPAQRAALMNDRLAKTVLYNAKDRFGPHPTQPQRQFLSMLRDQLRKEYPGFEENVGLPEKVKTEDKIAELERAVDDPDLADDPTATSIRTYLAARARMTTIAGQAGYVTFVKAKSLRPLREFMRQFGEALVQENPRFATVWDRVFSNEMIEDVGMPEVAVA